MTTPSSGEPSLVNPPGVLERRRSAHETVCATSNLPLHTRGNRVECSKLDSDMRDVLVVGSEATGRSVEVKCRRYPVKTTIVVGFAVLQRIDQPESSSTSV